MDRRHLRCQDRVSPAHLLRERDLLDRGLAQPAPGLLGVTDADRRDQRAHADTGAAKVIDLVDLEAGVYLVRAGQNIVHLVGSDRIDPAAEGVELDQVKIVPSAHIAGGGVKS